MRKVLCMPLKDQMVEINLRRLSEAACKIAVMTSQFRCNLDKFLSR